MKKKLTLALLILAPFLVRAEQNVRVSDWMNHYYVDAKMDQAYLNGIASFIAYLMEKDPSENGFDTELKIVREEFKSAPNYFSQGLIKLFKNSFSQVYVPNQPAIDQAVWRTALMDYYQPVYNLLDEKHKTFNYGEKKGDNLPPLK